MDEGRVDPSVDDDAGRRQCGVCVLCSVLIFSACGVRNDAAAGTGSAQTNDAAEPGGTPATFNVFDHIPQFGVYATTNPNYTPPSRVVTWAFGTVFVTKLDLQQQAAIGSDLAARVTYFAQCDDYDRIGAVFFVFEPTGQAPKPDDARTEIVRFITPFSDYLQGDLAKHVYPDADISTYASVLADATHDVWIGIAGGSNPYDGDPCTGAAASAEFKAVGFKYSVDFVSTSPLVPGPSMTLNAVASVAETSVPIAATLSNPRDPVAGHVIVIVSGHGSDPGGDEYASTVDTVTVAGAAIGAFSTKVDCAPYGKFSPDGNPGIFQNNLSNNPRNWCPGALLPSHSFPLTLGTGSSAVALDIQARRVPPGSTYLTSINFSSL